MKRVLCLFCALVTLCACRPTPQTEPVVNKADAVAEDAVRGEAVPAEPYEAPERWTETIELHENLKLTIDAPVILGEGDAHPVSIIKRQRMTPVFLKDWVQSVFPNVIDIREQRESLEELQEQLGLIERGELVETDSTGQPVFEPYDPIDRQEMIDAVMERMQSLPEEASYEPLAPGHLVLQNEPLPLHQSDDTIVWLNGYDTGNGSAAILHTNRSPHIQREIDILQERGEMPGGPGPITGIIVTEEAAAEQAKAVLEAFGRNDLALAACSKARNVSIYPEWGEIVSTGYLLYFTPTVPGSVAYWYSEQNLGEARLDSEAFSKSWRQESVCFYVSNRGIESATYANPYEIVETANENVRLLPFSAIQERVRKMLQYGYGWTNAYTPEDSGVGNTICVSQVTLTAAAVPVKDDPDHAYLIPAWAIRFNTELGLQTNGDDHVMLINAIDGSLIQQND